MRSFFTLFSCYAIFAREQRGDVRIRERERRNTKQDIIALSDRIVSLYQGPSPPPTRLHLRAVVAIFIPAVTWLWGEDCKKGNNSENAQGPLAASFLPFSCCRWHTSKCYTAEKRIDLTRARQLLRRRKRNPVGAGNARKPPKVLSCWTLQSDFTSRPMNPITQIRRNAVTRWICYYISWIKSCRSLGAIWEIWHCFRRH